MPVRSLTAPACALGTLLLTACSCSVDPPPADTAQGAGETSKYEVLSFQEFSAGLPRTGTWLGYPRLADLNGDGRCDIVASNREEDGYSVWRCPPGLTPGYDGEEPLEWILQNQGLPRDMMYGSCSFGDFNGDGALDIAVNAHSEGLKIFLNDGKILPGDGFLNTGTDPETGEAYSDDRLTWTETSSKIQNLFLLLDCQVGNIDGDEHPDVAGIGHFKGGIALFRGDGQGGAARMPESAALLEPDVFGREILLVDVDGNGLDDIVTTSNVGGQVLLTKGTKESLYWENISEGLPNPQIGNSIYAVAVADFIEGGWPEVAFASISASSMKKRTGIEEQADDGDPPPFGLYAWNAEKERWDLTGTGLPDGDAYREVKATDFNLDGHMDLLVCDVHEGPVILLGDGLGGFTAVGRLDTTGRSRADIGDIDGDGAPDVVIAFSAKEGTASGVRTFLNRPGAWGLPEWP